MTANEFRLFIAGLIVVAPLALGGWAIARKASKEQFIKDCMYQDDDFWRQRCALQWEPTLDWCAATST